MNPEENNENPAPKETQESPRLVVEGGIQVLYKGVWVKEIPFDRDEIGIGVMDPENDIYPDINLRQYRLEGGDPYISRRHGKFTRKDGKYFVEDVCNNNSTSVDTKSNIINNEQHELQPGMRVFISESVAFRFEVAPPEEEKPEATAGADQEWPKWYLEVEGQIPLFFRPSNTFTHLIELNPAEWKIDPKDGLPALHIGRRSTEDNVYPDLDLWKFYFNDADEYIARKHARIFAREGKLYFQDLSGKGSTWYNVRDDEHRLVRTDTDEAKYEIQLEDKLLISDSAVFVVRKQEAIESQEEEEIEGEGEGKGEGEGEGEKQAE